MYVQVQFNRVMHSFHKDKSFARLRFLETWICGVGSCKSSDMLYPNCNRMLHEYEMFGCLELTEELPKYGKTA